MTTEKNSNPGIRAPQWLISAHNRDQPTFHSALLVKKQFLRAPKRCVQPHNNDPNNERHQHVQPHIGQHQCDHSNKAQRSEHDPVVQVLPEEDDRGVSTEVEGEPSDEDDEEDDHGDRVPEEAEEEDEEHGHGVVGPEVVEVPSDARHGVLIGVWEGEGGDWDEELGPWPAGGYYSSGCVRGA
jgi:hypothetical protein